MKKILILLLVLLLCGCENKSEIKTYQKYKTYHHLDKEIVENAEIAGAIIDFAYEYTFDYLYENADAIVIASIISIDDANTKVTQSVGNSYGKLVINNVFKGDLKEEQVIEYMKAGGTMTVADYDEYQDEESKNARKEARLLAGYDDTKIYQTHVIPNDPIIEEGKVYLCYLHYVASIDKYEILIKNGFRQLNIPKSNYVTSAPIDITKYEILNNETEQYENLEEFINKYLKRA